MGPWPSTNLLDVTLRYIQDMCYGKAEEKDKIQEIGKLGWFERDPLYGDEGPVLQV